MDHTAPRFTPTQDWVSYNVDHWTKLFDLVQSKQPRVLEIGSWEGRSAVFLLNNLCREGGEIVCIDHFDLFRTIAGKERFERMRHNLGTTGKTFRILSEFSTPALMRLLEEEIDSPNPGYDWVYVDGSHEADDTLLDGELVWRLAREGCIVIFDDYHWDKEPEDSMHHPKRGIDAFLDLHHGQYERLTSEDQYQVVLRKTSPMRIGFAKAEGTKHNVDVDASDAFGYSINIAFTIDMNYAMPVAVAIRSILEHTSARISIYIIDYGLSDTDKKQIKDSIPLHDNSTLMFLSPPKEGPGTTIGVTWAKLELHQIVPVERVLYLDADILVRRDLTDLWSTDLKGKPIGAVIDVGHPMGHSESGRRPYFNAGVLLMDLAKIRGSGTEGIESLIATHSHSKFEDQDVLNLHFKGGWTHIPLRWNAQGLGTYAKYPSPERAALDLTEMNDDTYLVHFTGPVDPTAGEILNPYVQPPTAKPWGYIGAPGHPFQEEWWAVLERTQWGCAGGDGGGGGSCFDSLVFEKQRKEARGKKAAAGIVAFHQAADGFVNQLKQKLTVSS